MTTQCNRAGVVHSLSVTLAVAGLLGLSETAHADPVVNDPNFSQTSSSPWTTSGDAVLGNTVPPGSTSLTDLALGTGSISQTLTGLVAGATYTITFDLAADQTTINNAQDSFFSGDGISGDATVTVGLGSDTPGVVDAIANYASATVDAYQSQSFIDTAATASELLSFTGVNTINPGTIDPATGDPYANGTWYLTNVSVVCSSAACQSTTVPEPPAILTLVSALLMMLGFAGAYRRFSR